MKKFIRKWSIFWLCAVCAVAFACCAQNPQSSTPSSTPPSAGTSGESSGNSGTGGDENELPRVPY